MQRRLLSIFCNAPLPPVQILYKRGKHMMRIASLSQSYQKQNKVCLFAYPIHRLLKLHLYLLYMYVSSSHFKGTTLYNKKCLLTVMFEAGNPSMVARHSASVIFCLRSRPAMYCGRYTQQNRGCQI
jgi:hypothetical protein